MATLTFDTYQLVQHLKESGISEKQAEAITYVIKDAHTASEVATKSDIHELRLEMKAMESSLVARIAENKAELVRWVVGAGFLQTALICALLLKLIK
jgi:hypothetical protein